MMTPELNMKLEKLLQMVQNADEILKQQAKEIYNLPQAERKPYLDEHYTIKDYVDESWLILSSLAAELDKRATKQQFAQCKQQLTKAREYIIILGGNPSNLTFA
jgi:peptidase E